jgi:hypothetical protein
LKPAEQAHVDEWRNISLEPVADDHLRGGDPQHTTGQRPRQPCRKRPLPWGSRRPGALLLISCGLARVRETVAQRHERGCLDSRPASGLWWEGFQGHKPDKAFPSARNAETVLLSFSSPMRGGSGLSGLSGFNSCLWVWPGERLLTRPQHASWKTSGFSYP